MKPRSFDVQTCREMLGDELARQIEARARDDADKGLEAYSPIKPEDFYSWWDTCKNIFVAVVYHEQFLKRLERNKRKQG